MRKSMQEDWTNSGKLLAFTSNMEQALKYKD